MISNISAAQFKQVVETYRVDSEIHSLLVFKNPKESWVISDNSWSLSLDEKRIYIPSPIALAVTIYKADKTTIADSTRFIFTDPIYSSDSNFILTPVGISSLPKSGTNVTFKVSINESNIELKEGYYIRIVKTFDSDQSKRFIEGIIGTELFSMNGFSKVQNEEFQVKQPGILIMGEFVHLPAPPDMNSNSDIERYEAELVKSVLPRIDQIYICSVDVSDYTLKFNHYSQSLFGNAEDLSDAQLKINITDDLLAIKKHNDEVNKELESLIAKYENPSRFSRDEMLEKIQQFEKDVIKSIDKNYSIAEVNAKVELLLEKHLDFTGRYASEYLDNISSKACVNPPPEMKVVIRDLGIRREQEYESTLSIYNSVTESRIKRLKAKNTTIEALRAELHLVYAEKQGYDLLDLNIELRHNIELLRLGEEIYHWSNRLALSGYTNRLETLYLQFSAPLAIIAKRRIEADNYKTAVRSFSHATNVIPETYLRLLDKRIKMLDHLDTSIKTKGWQGFLEDQIWHAHDMKDFLDYYPAECKLLIDDFIKFAEQTKNYEIFKTTEVKYFNLVKSCDEKSK